MLGDAERPHDHQDSQGPGAGAARARANSASASASRSSIRRFAPRTRRSAASRRSPGTRTATAARRRSRGRPAAATPIPDYDLSVEWIETTAAPRARRRQRWADPATPTRALVICGSPRNDGTCPGEISKTFRLAELVERGARRRRGIEVDFLDLSLLTSEYGRKIHPCKGCVSTAMPLCHWPCSCYPNHALDQINDWMNEIYERWVAAHARRHRHADALVQHVERAQADDRPARLRRRRQSRSDLDARQEARGGEGARARGLGLSEAPRRPRLRPGRARRRRRHRGLAARAVATGSTGWA